LQEHVGYLSDAVRNERFRRAIAQVMQPGDVVVDLGCGFGVLGLMCLEQGAARVWGIDQTEAVEIARQSAARTGYADRYHCLRETTFRAALPEPADIAICDHVGWFGLDYGIAAMTADARARMLRPGGTVVPGKITLIVAGVTSPSARELAEAWTAPEMPTEFRWLRDYSINTKHPYTFERDMVVTEPVALGTVDLNADIADSLSFKAELTAQADGALDGLGGWFDCEIVPGISMTNSPLAPDPISRNQVFLAFDQPMAVSAGDTVAVTVSLRHESGTLAWTVRNLRSGEMARQTTWRSQILAEADLAKPAERVPRVGRLGAARRLVLDYADGVRTSAEIEDLILRDHPGLLPTEAEARRFIRSELLRNER